MSVMDFGVFGTDPYAVPKHLPGGDNRVVAWNTRYQQMLVSVIMCTCNRGAKLEASLASLRDQQLDASCDLEILVVDNNSTDTTGEVARRYVERCPNRFKYLFEARQGKSYALNHGIAHAQGDVIALLDDDCIAAPDWIKAITRELRGDEDLSLIGGRVELFDRDDLPLTIRTFDERVDFDSTAQLFSLIPGCNMAMRRTVIDRIGNFDVDLGPGTPHALVAEDTEFLYRALSAGLQMAYSPVPLVYHDHGRRDDAARVRLERSYVRGRGALYCKHILRGDGTMLRMAYWEIRKNLGMAMRWPPWTPTGVRALRLTGYLVAGMFWRVIDEMRHLGSRRPAH